MAARKTSLSYKPDMLEDTKQILSDLGGFKGALVPGKVFAEKAPRLETDSAYHPHAAGEKQ